MRSTSALLPSLLALGLLLARPALAWSDHTLGTREALSVLPEVARATVQAEPLEGFLEDQAPQLAGLLEEEERWARQLLTAYPPRPDALAFHAGGDRAGLRQRFLAALRVNPQSRLGLFVQAAPGQEVAAADRLDWREVTALHGAGEVSRNGYRRLAAGEPVAALEVVATAADEPDYGLDVGLWADNGTDWGRRYGFGAQPFGNPALEYSSQAPFHMGFFHEASVIYAAAGFLRRTYPEVRVHLYRALAAQAFRSGHRYWGWRFAGWALHYVQDLTQPYHARVLPGVGVVRMLWINALDLMGAHGAMRAAVTLVSNRHLVLEDYQCQLLRGALAAGRVEDPLRRALQDTSGDGALPGFDDGTVRQEISRQAHAAADGLDEALAHSFPARYTSDPAFAYDDAEDPAGLAALAGAGGPAARQALDTLLEVQLRAFGRASRALVRALPVPKS